MNGSMGTYLFGGAAIGLLTSCWSYIKTFIWKICNLFVQKIEIEDEHLADAVANYLVANYPRSRLYDRVYGSKYDYIRFEDRKKPLRTGLVSFEHFGGNSLIFWNGWFPFIWNSSQAGNGNNPNSNGADPNTSIGGKQSSGGKGFVTFLRGTIDIDRIMSEAANIKNQFSWDEGDFHTSSHRRFMIKFIPDISKDETKSGGSSSSWWFRLPEYRLLNYKASQLGMAPQDEGNCLDQLVFPKHVKNLIEEIKLWKENRDWYNKHNVPWKRGWLIFGVGGTGKTMLARAFGEDLDMPIFVFNLAELTNYEFMRQWQLMHLFTPCIALFEDIDNVFHGRVNIAAGRQNGFMSLMHRVSPIKREHELSKTPPSDMSEEENLFASGAVNFDTFLNCLDGVQKCEGVFTIITTNRIEHIDPALGQPRKKPDGTVEFISTRPGRIDKAIELTYMELEDKRILASRILAEYPDALANMDRYLHVHGMELETPAQFQERCAQIALRCFWEEKQARETIHQYVLVTNEDTEDAPKKTPATELTKAEA